MGQIFFHIDVNSAFLSWTAVENLRNGSQVDLRLIPSIIGGDIERRHGIVLAKSIPAKKYNIVTGESIMKALKKCPSLHIAPPDHTMYESYSQALFTFLSDICPDLEQASIDECYMDFTPISSQYRSPYEAALILKEQIYHTFGFTVNIGISDRKILAKMASDFKKPNLVHTLYTSEIRTKMWSLPISDLFMCGRSSIQCLHKLGILTIGDLANTDPEILISHLKSHGKLLWEYANGKDESVISPAPSVVKGIGNSITLSQDVITAKDAHLTLLHLSESVAARLRKQRRYAAMISVEIKYSTFESVSHQRTISCPTNSTECIYQNACRLFDEIWNQNAIRLLGLRTSKLTDLCEPVQLSLFDDTEIFEKSEKQKQLDQAIDQIRSRYGNQSITRGSLLKRDASFKKH